MTTTVIPSWVMTYDSLTSTVLQYLERKDQATVNAIPTFITLAEFEIAEQIKTLGQLQIAESTMLAGNPLLQKPARWRKTVSMSVTIGGKNEPVIVTNPESKWNVNKQDVTLSGGGLQSRVDYSFSDATHGVASSPVLTATTPCTTPASTRKPRSSS